MKRTCLVLTCVLSVLLLNACTSPSSHHPDNNGGGIQQAPAPDAQARQLQARGDYLGAARVYVQLARNSQTPTRQLYQISAVELLVKANLIQQAKQQLQAIQNIAHPALETRVQLAWAEVEIAEQRPQQALQRLQSIDIRNLPSQWRKPYYHLSALALEAQNDFAQALSLRMRMDNLLVNRRESDYNHNRIWQLLMKLTPAQISQQITQTSDGNEKGWLELALLMQTTHSSRLAQSLQEWHNRFPTHVAGRSIVPQLSQGGLPQMAGNTSYARHMALLLPLNGKYQKAAEAIRDGFFAAWYGQSGERPQIKLYDSSTGNIVDTYAQALKQGAYAVIGPLQKENLLALAQAFPRLPVATLALNRFEPGQPGTPEIPYNVYQFSLAPEDEAWELAQWAWQEGYRTAAILVPQSARGQRMSMAFSTSWESLGGQVVDYQSYAEHDFAGPVKQLVKGGAAPQVVFVDASPAAGRQIRPQFRYFLAQSLPLFASSRIYAGQVAPTLDHDLNGVNFVETPWLLHDVSIQGASPLYSAVSSTWPQRMEGSVKRLFAFGIDAYHIASRIHLLNNPANFSLSGESGALYTDSNGIIHRHLRRARFKNGKALILDELPAPLKEEELPSADFR